MTSTETSVTILYGVLYYDYCGNNYFTGIVSSVENGKKMIEDKIGEITEFSKYNSLSTSGRVAFDRKNGDIAGTLIPCKVDGE